MKLAVMLIIESNDPRLDPERIDVSTAAKAAALRQAVIKHLPHKVERVVMVTDEEHARLMALAHDMVMKEMGETIPRPPADYVAPGRE